MERLFQAICRTMVYADIFDYPLTDEEIWQYLISGHRIGFDLLKSKLNQAVDQKQISVSGKLFFFKGRKKIVAVRNRRAKAADNKMRIAHRVAWWLKFIPTVRMIAITGALAMRNSEKDDDIDLLIVTAKKRLWLTRLLATFLVELVAERRRPNDRKFRDKICLNMFLDEENLVIPRAERNLFSSHEVCQLKPIWDRGNIYKRFIKENKWTTQYLANWKPLLTGCR